MCIAIPGEIVEIDSNRMTAKTSVSGNVLDVDIRMVSVEEGDYVLVHAGCAMEKIEHDNAMEIISLLAELEELSADDA